MMMLNKLTACALALCIAASVLMGIAAVAQPEVPGSAITMCDLDYIENGS